VAGTIHVPSAHRLIAMRRRCDAHVIWDGAPREINNGPPTGQIPKPATELQEVPEEWRKHAREPWRILFPDLEWTPLGRDETVRR
jgi:hypothetical protein